MKYLKTLGLAAIAAAALMAFAGSASATELTSPASTMVGVGVKIHAVSEGHAVLDSPIGEIKCNSTVEGRTANTGGSGETVVGEVTALTFTGCTDGADVTVLKLGTLEVHSLGSTNGTVTSTGTRVTVELFGAHCEFETNATDIGTLTGGNPATLDISARIPHVGGRSGALCGTTSPWTGSYEVTTPKPLFVD